MKWGKEDPHNIIIIHYKKKHQIHSLSPFEEFKNNLSKIREPQSLINKNDVKSCMNMDCGKKFGLFNHKFHCFHCGK